jgi:hypothetical protein
MNDILGYGISVYFIEDGEGNALASKSGPLSGIRLTSLLADFVLCQKLGSQNAVV